MPTTATITAFYVFQVKDRMRIGNTNGNFSNYRGHIIPIDPNTSTAATSRFYDLGSTDYRWRTTYAAKIDVSLTSTVSATIEANTSGEYKFITSETSTFFVLKDSGFVGYNYLPIAENTTTALTSGIAVSSNINLSTVTAGLVVGSTCTITTNGRPVIISISPSSDATTATSQGITISSVESTVMSYGIIEIHRNGVAFAATEIRKRFSQALSPTCAFRFFDFPAAGTYNYSLNVSLVESRYLSGITASGYATYMSFVKIKLMATEL